MVFPCYIYDMGNACFYLITGSKHVGSDENI